jgi:DNA (cytosine-5)-methyltransferase 1
MPSISTDFRIRKLTERECFRLMGVREDDIDKLLKAGISKTQLYKLAGNSIVCDVLMAIFDKMLVNTKAEKGQQLSLF